VGFRYNFALVRISLKTVARIWRAAHVKARLPIRRGSERAREGLKFRWLWTRSESFYYVYLSTK